MNWDWEDCWERDQLGKLKEEMRLGLVNRDYQGKKRSLNWKNWERKAKED
jgi:hypothetical protein